MELHGVTGKPYNHPQVRRTVPVFTRNSVTLGAVKRSWKDTSVVELTKGDTVAGFGTVAVVVEYLPKPGEVRAWGVRLYNVMGDFMDFPGEDRVFAFTRDRKKK